MRNSLSPQFPLQKIRKAEGFTLIELAVVLVIIGIVISVVATILPSLIKSAKIKKTEAILEKVDYALRGSLIASQRLPYADSDKDGSADSGVYFGWLPFKDLGLSSGDDAWDQRIKYGVYEDVVTTNLCNISTPTTVDTAKLHTISNSDGSATQQIFVIISGGDATGQFEAKNSDDNAEYDDPHRITLYNNGVVVYNDIMVSGEISTLKGIVCGGGTGTGTGTTGVENTAALCSDGTDNDSDGYTDCSDQDCYGLDGCEDGPPTASVHINTGAMSNGIVGNSYTHTFQATGGSGYYYWYLDSISPNISGLGIGLWTGVLSGSIDNCEGTYSVDTRVEDRYDSGKTDSHTFTLTVVNGALSISPAPSGGGPTSPDFTVNSSTFSQDFTASGPHFGDLNWTLAWVGTDPGGFQANSTSSTTGKFWKSGFTTVGTYTFTLTATDGTCSSNTITTNSYTIKIEPQGIGSPYTEGMVGEWRLDECAWDGTTGEVKDSGDNVLDGTAVNGADTTGAGKICRAGYFDGTNDYVTVPDQSELQLTAPLSLALWVKVNANASDWVRLAGKGDSTNRNYGLWLATNGTILFQIYSQSGNGDSQTTVTVNDGDWHHIAGVYDGATMKVYIDDVERASINYTYVPRTSNDPFTMGYAGFHTYLNGVLDEVMLFNKALDTDDLTTIYESTRTSCTGSCYTNPMAEYRMENFPWTGTAGEVVDSGSGGSNGVAAIQGTGSLPTQTTPSSGKVCRAGVFTRVDASNGGYLDLGDPADGDLDPDTDPWTVSAWVKWDGSGGNNFIYDKQGLYQARVRNGYVTYRWRPAWTWYGGTSFSVIADTWSYVTVVYDGFEQVFYKDGAQVFSRSQTGAMGSNSNKLLIGGERSGSPRNFFGGTIDEVKIYNRAIAENEIKADMDETRDCSADSVVITTTSLPQGTINSAYSTTVSATGGTLPYGWDIIAPNPISGLSIVPNTGELNGTINVCAGDYDLTISVTDAASRVDEQTLTLTVANGTLSLSPSAQTFNCTTSTFYQDFTASGARIGALGAWQIQWLGTNPGGFEVTSTGDNTARFRKIGDSGAGSGYQFKLTAQDGSCSDNQLDSGYYTINISGEGTNSPYYSGMVGEWHMDECTWDGTTGEILDTSGSGAHGESHQMGTADTPDRSIGEVCYCAALNLGSTTNQYVTLGPQPFNALGDFSLSMWFRVDTLSSSISTLFSGARSGAYNNLLLFLDSAGTNLLTWVNNAQTGNFSLGSTVADGLWHLVVWTRKVSDGTETIYLDGSAISDSNSAADTSNVTLDAGGVILGQEQDSFGGGFAANQVFHGWIDEVLLYDKVLSQTEVNTLLSLSHDCSGSCYTGFVADYRMDEDSWTIGQADEVADSSGNNYHGTPYGSAAINQSDSHVCYAGEFVNNNSYIAIAGLPVSTTAGDKTTVCFWMKWAGNASEMPIGWGSSYDLWFRTADQFGFNTGCSDLYGISGASALASDWYHVAAVFTNNSPSKNQLYINGTLQPITLLAGSQCNRSVSSTFYISGWNTGSSYKYDGLIDELRVYTRGLSASEVSADMTLTHSCPGGP